MYENVWTRLHTASFTTAALQTCTAQLISVRFFVFFRLLSFESITEVRIPVPCLCRRMTPSRRKSYLLLLLLHLNFIIQTQQNDSYKATTTHTHPIINNKTTAKKKRQQPQTARPDGDVECLIISPQTLSTLHKTRVCCYGAFQMLPWDDSRTRLE